MDQSGFIVTSTTILAANVGGNKYLVQVCPTTVRLLDASAVLVQDLEMESGFTVTSASILDPYIALVSSSGRTALIRFSETSRNLTLTYPIPTKVNFILRK